MRMKLVKDLEVLSVDTKSCISAKKCGYTEIPRRRWRQSRDTHCVVSNAKLVDSQYVRERKNKVSSMEPLKGAHPTYPLISTSGLWTARE